MYLLDTNVVSALRIRRPNLDKVWEWAESVDVTRQYLSAITILELERGIHLAERRDSPKGVVLREWFEQVLVRFSPRILAIDQTVARRCSALHVPDPLPDLDALIAATALTHSLTVVTRNIRDFERTGVQTLDPWA
jgi:predicted nucleic acid-binding protein